MAVEWAGLGLEMDSQQTHHTDTSQKLAKASKIQEEQSHGHSLAARCSSSCTLLPKPKRLNHNNIMTGAVLDSTLETLRITWVFMGLITLNDHQLGQVIEAGMG